MNETRLAEESQNIAPLCNTLRGRKGASALSKLPWNKDVWVRSMLLIGEQRAKSYDRDADGTAAIKL